MDTNEAKVKAVVEVTHNVAPANATGWNANVRASYETERQYQETLKNNQGK